jgi:phenylalanyl-tRNA synthetase beta chain
VAIGTHDYDTLQGPFTYDAVDPKEISFKALNQKCVMSAKDLFSHYRTNDKHISKFLPIIENFPKYPLIRDAKGTVCSLPPIINGDHSKVHLNTKNIFIECTATDSTKANVVLNTIIAMYSEYAKKPFTVEPVQVVYPDNTVLTYPDLSTKKLSASLNFITSSIGIELSAKEVVFQLERMGLGATLSRNETEVIVEVPITRSDILHACDVMEDVAIAYGFNKIPKTVPTVSTIGKALPLNKLSDLVRRELALMTFSEVLPLTLCSHDENFSLLRRKDDHSAVELANPKTIEYQVVRTSLIPGILKTLRENKSKALPIKIFEVSDIVLQDDREERRSKNERRVCVAYANKKSGFEIIHGILGRLMNMLNVASNQWKITESTMETYFPGRRADIWYQNQIIGQFGILHPEVILNFELQLPISLLELNLEPFL